MKKIVQPARGIMVESCPVCNCKVIEPVEYCRRCGSYLLLLEKIRRKARQLTKQGKWLPSNALYKSGDIPQIFEI